MKFLVVVSLCVACSHGDRTGGQKLTMHALPGFSVSLPPGQVIDDESSKYAEGSYGFGIKGSWAVMIEWRGAPVSKPDYASYGEAWKLDYAKRLALAPSNLKAETYAGTNHGPARLSFITCGTRYIAIGTIDRTDVDKLHRDVLASFTCTPDPTKERRAAVRVALASMEGWTRAGDDPRVVMLSRNRGAQVFLGLYYASEPDRQELERLVRRYQGTVGPGDPHPISAAGARGWLRVLRCGSSSYVVAVYIEQGSGTAARTTIDGARCLRDGEPDVAWPAGI